MKLKEFVTLVTNSITPISDRDYHLYSLPSFDENQTREEVRGYEIQSNKYDVPNKCILFNKLNVRFKRVWRIDNTDSHKLASTEFLPLVVDEELIDYQYCYYLLVSDKITNYLSGQNANTSGSHKRIAPEVLLNIDVELPPISEQKRIGKLLGELDSKIAVNREINRNLEAMARQLYDYWFVQFDFPDENGKPYKSSGGKMVWNDRLKRYLPDGWSDCTLNRYIGRITNGLNPRKNFVLGNGNNFYVTIKSLVGRDIDWHNCDKCDDAALSKISSRSQLKVGDVIFSAIGTIGRTYFIQEEPTNWNISETSFTLRPSSDIDSHFFYSLLTSDEVQLQADKNAMGSTLRCLVMDSLCGIPYIDIPTNICSSFAEKVHGINMEIAKLNRENLKLLDLRNGLLPLLMNGQVSVMPTAVNCDLPLWILGANVWNIAKYFIPL